jgi:hypothetical protein
MRKILFSLTFATVLLGLASSEPRHFFIRHSYARLSACAPLIGVAASSSARLS